MFDLSSNQNEGLRLIFIDIFRGLYTENERFLCHKILNVYQKFENAVFVTHWSCFSGSTQVLRWKYWNSEFLTELIWFATQTLLLENWARDSTLFIIIVWSNFRNICVSSFATKERACAWSLSLKRFYYPPRLSSIFKRMESPNDCLPLWNVKLKCS